MSCIYRSNGECHLIAANRQNGSSAADDARCARCPHYRGPLRGLGDAIAAVTKAVNIEPCGGCAKRREELNRIAPNPFKPG